MTWVHFTAVVLPSGPVHGQNGWKPVNRKITQPAAAAGHKGHPHVAVRATSAGAFTRTDWSVARPPDWKAQPKQHHMLDLPAPPRHTLIPTHAT